MLMSVDHPSQPSSCSSFDPGGAPEILIRCCCETTSTTPSRTSSAHIPPGTLAMVRTLPTSVTPRRLSEAPESDAENQTSSLEGDQITPSMEVQPVESFRS